MGGRRPTAQWECFLPLGNTTISCSGNAPASDRDQPRTDWFSDTSLSRLGRDGIESIPLVTRMTMAHALQQPHTHDSHRHLLAAGQVRANMLSGAKSFRCINSWPQLLVRPLDSGCSWASKVYLTSRLAWLARMLASPRNVAFFLGPVGKATSRCPPLPRLLTYRSRRRPAR